MSPADIAAASASLEREPPEEALRWAVQRFPGRVGFATAFGPEGCVLLEAIAREQLAVDVFTLEVIFHNYACCEYQTPEGCFTTLGRVL